MGWATGKDGAASICEMQVTPDSVPVELAGGGNTYTVAGEAWAGFPFRSALLARSRCFPDEGRALAGFS